MKFGAFSFPFNEKEEGMLGVVGLFYVYGLAFRFLFLLFGDSDV